jgi:proline iminopeptidase
MLTEIQAHYDVKSAFEEFDQEVLIIQGKQTPIGEETALEVLANFPNARIEWIHECGHFPWIEQPQLFYGALLGFLE